MSKFLFKLFYPILLILILLSLFLMETEYKFYLFPLWTIFLLSYNFMIGEKKIRLSKLNLSLNKNSFFYNIFVFAFLFIFFSFIAIIFSHHLPLSLEKYLFYLTSINIFLFFLQIKNKFFKIELFIEYFLLLTFVLNILVIVLNFIPNSRELFQGMNLLVRSYGHNHYVAFLLLALPLIWWHLLKKTPTYFMNKKSKTSFDVFLLISSYFLLLMSLSRWALLLGIIQLFVIFLLNKKDFYNLHKNKIVYFLIKSLILSFLSVALIFLFLSLPLLINNKDGCPLRFYRKDLCISLNENSRFFYWRQACLTFKNYPVFGYGLGSFKHSARRFPIVNEQHSAYAHNIFLHNLAEMGILGGGSFILFVFYIFYRAGSLILKSKKPLGQFLYLAAISSLINALLDFDWHFFVIFLLTLVFLAFIFLELGIDDGKRKNYSLWPISLFILTVFTVFSFFTNFLTPIWKAKKLEHQLKFDHFLNSIVKESVDQSTTVINNYESLYNLYRYDTDFIHRFLKLEGLNQERKKQLYLDLAKIDPAGFIISINFKDWSLENAEILLKEFLEIENNYQIFNDYFFIGYRERINLAEQIYGLGQSAYMQDDLLRASYFYQIAYFFDPHIFFNERAIFLDENDLDKLLLFFLNFKNFPPNATGDYYHYLFLYKKVLTKLFEENRLSDFEQLVKAVIDQEPAVKNYLIGHLKAEFTNKEKNDLLKRLDQQ